MTEPTDFERAALASLQRELETMRAQAAGRLRADNALHMSAQQWAAIYGHPVAGSSRGRCGQPAERPRRRLGRRLRPGVLPPRP
jgi:hypothetical protein